MAVQNDDVSRLTSLLTKLKDSPLAAVFAIGLLAGSGGSGLRDFLVPPRADPYTGTMGKIERQARVSGDDTLAKAIETERVARVQEDSRLARRIQEFEIALDAWMEVWHQHDKKSGIRDERIKRIEKDAHVHNWSKGK